MIKDHLQLIHENREWENPAARITRLVRDGKVTRIRRGLYMDPPDSLKDVAVLAGLIYGPSYISFGYALARYGMIPESVPVITSAVFNKNKRKVFHTTCGMFQFIPVPQEAFHTGLHLMQAPEGSWLMASREKALLDQLFAIPGRWVYRDVESLLIDDLRLNPSDLSMLDLDWMSQIAGLYPKRLPSLATRWMKENLIG